MHIMKKVPTNYSQRQQFYKHNWLNMRMYLFSLFTIIYCEQRPSFCFIVWSSAGPFCSVCSPHAVVNFLLMLQFLPTVQRHVGQFSLEALNCQFLCLMPDAHSFPFKTLNRNKQVWKINYWFEINASGKWFSFSLSRLIFLFLNVALI